MFLTDIESQTLLKETGLFSARNLKIYDKQTAYYDFENVYLNSKINSVNVFTNITEINNLKSQSLKNYFA